MLIWDDSMTTGIDSIDAQHKELIEKFNEFSAILANRSVTESDYEAAGEILDYLQFYAAWHFSREEACFDEYNCPVAKANKNAHANFLKMFGEFYEQWWTDGMDSDLIRKTFDELTTWVTEHILRIDSKAYPCVQEYRKKHGKNAPGEGKKF